MNVIKKEDSYMTATSEGRVYVETGTFLKEKEVVETIEKLMNSSIFKAIQARKKLQVSKKSK